MKTAIYIEDGTTQLVLTPETEYEKGVVGMFGDRLNRVQLFEGSFYDCRGGWVRQTAYYPARGGMMPHEKRDGSLIMKIDSDEKGLAPK